MMKCKKCGRKFLKNDFAVNSIPSHWCKPRVKQSISKRNKFIGIAKYWDLFPRENKFVNANLPLMEVKE